MAENLYEGMFVLDSGAFTSDHEGAIKQVTDLIENSGGTVSAHRPWQEGRLAYEIDKHRKAVHYLTCFQMPSDRVKDLNRACQLNDIVLRHMFINQPSSIYNAMVGVLNGEVPEDAVDESDDDAVAVSVADDDDDDDE